MRTLGQGRLQPVLHVLHLEELALGAHRVRRPSWRAAASRTTSAPTSSSTRPTSSPRSCSTAGRRRSPAGSSSPPRSARATGSTRASSTSSTCRSRPGSEEYLDSEKYEVKRARARRPAAAARRPRSTRSAARTRRCSSSTNITFLDTENDALIAYAKRTGDDVVITRRQPRPARRPGGRRASCPYELGLPAGLRASPTCSTATRFDWRLGATTCASHPASAAHVLRVA